MMRAHRYASSLPTLLYHWQPTTHLHAGHQIVLSTLNQYPSPQSYKELFARKQRCITPGGLLCEHRQYHARTCTINKPKLLCACVICGAIISSLQICRFANIMRIDILILESRRPGPVLELIRLRDASPQITMRSICRSRKEAERTSELTFRPEEEESAYTHRARCPSGIAPASSVMEGRRDRKQNAELGKRMACDLVTIILEDFRAISNTLASQH
jgi:hypothetical protein